MRHCSRIPPKFCCWVKSALYPLSIIAGDEQIPSVSILPLPNLKIHTTFLSHAGSLFDLVAEAGQCDAIQKSD